MTLSEIVAKIRRSIREVGKQHYSDATIESTVEDGIRAFALRLRAKAPDLLVKRVALHSTHHIFDWPDDCNSIQNVWDLGSNAGQITNASNETPIVITQYSHGYETGETVTVQGVGGNTAANGTWTAAYVDANNFTLVGSAGNGAYVADSYGYLYDSGGNLITDSLGVALETAYGGLSWKEVSIPDLIMPKLPVDSDYSSAYRYYTRGKTVVVDDESFTDDIIVDYHYIPSTVDGIPTEYQHGLVSWGVVNLMRYEKDDAYIEDKKATVQTHSSILRSVMDDLSQFTIQTTEPETIRDVWMDKVIPREF